MKKREEREYSKELRQGARQRPRVDEEVFFLMGMPPDVRRIIMMKLDFEELGMLYRSSTSQDFRDWCDRDFWNYAFRQRFPDENVPDYMRENPRWLFYTYSIEARMYEDYSVFTEFRHVRDAIPNYVFYYHSVLDWQKRKRDDALRIDLRISAPYVGQNVAEKKETMIIFSRFLELDREVRNEDLWNFEVTSEEDGQSIEIFGLVAQVRAFVRQQMFRLFELGLGYISFWEREDGPDVLRSIRGKLPFIGINKE
jgi:hypothetical protein